MINNLNNSQLRTDEEIGYYARVAQIVKGYNTEELQIKQFSDSFISVVEKAEKAIHQKHGSEHTLSSQELEKLRDNGYVAFRDSVKANTYSIRPERAESARALEIVIRSHGWSMHLNGNKVQTAISDSLIADLKSVANQNCITTLNLTDLFTDMVSSHTDFVNMESIRLNDEASKEVFDRVEIYKEMRQCGQNLFNSIDLFYKINGSSILLDIAAKINAITKEYNAVARARKTKAQNAIVNPEQKN